MPGGAHENMRGWTPEEDEMLQRLILKLGKRWKLIAEELKPNDRTPAMVRNRYLRIERGKELTQRGESKNRCGQCGELKRGHICSVPRASVAASQIAQEIRAHEQRGIAARGMNAPPGGLYGLPPAAHTGAFPDGAAGSSPFGPPPPGLLSAPSYAHLDHLRRAAGASPPANAGAGALAPPLLQQSSSMELLARAASHASGFLDTLEKEMRDTDTRYSIANDLASGLESGLEADALAERLDDEGAADGPAAKRMRLTAEADDATSASVEGA